MPDGRIAIGPSLGKWYWLSLLTFTLAMLSKGSVAILPLVLLLLIWWSCGRITRRGCMQVAPFFLVAGVLTLVNIWLQNRGLDEPIRDANFGERLAGAGAIIWFYLYKALLPVNLLFVYPQWQIQISNLIWWLPLLATVTVTALSSCWVEVISGFDRCWLLGSFIAWRLLPVLGFTDVGFMTYTLVADHYQHLAIIAVVAVVAAMVVWWHQRATAPTQKAIRALAIVMLGILTWLTWRQNRLYANAITLYEATLAKNPDCWLVQSNLGTEFMVINENEKAIDHFRRALSLKHKYPDVQNNLGLTLAKIGKTDEAALAIQADRGTEPQVCAGLQ